MHRERGLNLKQKFQQQFEVGRRKAELKRGELKRKQYQSVGGGNQYIQTWPCPLPCLMLLC